jgi:hypothetical protein
MFPHNGNWDTAGPTLPRVDLTEAFETNDLPTILRSIDRVMRAQNVQAIARDRLAPRNGLFQARNIAGVCRSEQAKRALNGAKNRREFRHNPLK